jgi:long-chain acyl-CoA synthetase
MKGHPVRAEDELATLIYTSGTTGMPKGVMHTFGAFAWALDKGIQRIPMSGADRMLSYLPLAHVVERMLVEHGWLRTGMHVYFAESLDTFAADLQRARPTIFFSVPRLWVKFQQGIHHKMPPAKLNRLLGIPLIGGLVRKKVMKALGLDQCKFAAGGAAPMPVALLDWYDKLGLKINEGYGMTENLALSHITEPGKNQKGTVGPVYSGVEHRIDPETGEVQMRSPAMMMGYYKEPEKTREAFTADGWLRTGDKGTIDGQGLLRITGRVKDLFKTGKGKYVAPAPIEDKLVMHDSVEACVVTGANLGQPLGIVMLNAEAVTMVSDAAARSELEQSLTGHLKAINATLDPHERLQCVVVVTTAWTVDNDVITPTFKVKRNRIEDLYAKNYEAWESSGKKVIWQEG